LGIDIDPSKTVQLMIGDFLTAEDAEFEDLKIGPCVARELCRVLTKKIELLEVLTASAFVPAARQGGLGPCVASSRLCRICKIVPFLTTSVFVKLRRDKDYTDGH
jgi:hypothetical protein